MSQPELPSRPPGKAAGPVEEILSVSGRCAQRQPRLPTAELREGFGPRLPTRVLPLGLERALSGGKQSQGAVLGLPYPEERSVCSARAEGGLRGSCFQPASAPAQPSDPRSSHSPLPAFTLFSLTVRSLEGHPFPRVVGKGTLALKGGSGDPMTSGEQKSLIDSQGL